MSSQGLAPGRFAEAIVELLLTYEEIGHLMLRHESVEEGLRNACYLCAFLRATRTWFAEAAEGERGPPSPFLLLLAHATTSIAAEQHGESGGQAPTRATGNP
jgi:hypothetical protein